MSERLTDGPAGPGRVLDSVLADRLVTTLFQPIVDLDSMLTVAYEALSRGPAGSLESASSLFAAARSAGRVRELAALCEDTAIDTALERGIAAPMTLFINTEPEALTASRLDEIVAHLGSTGIELEIVLELTERSLAAHPSELLAAAERIRSAGWRLALDDVGVNDLSLTFMALLRPEVVKLDICMVQSQPNPDFAMIVNAVSAHAERFDAIIMAEGIENAEHVQLAQALGARFGQGWYLGQPGPHPAPAESTTPLRLPAARPARPVAISPFTCLAPQVQLRQSTRPLLVELSRALEREAERLGRTCLVVTAFQSAGHLTGPTLERYRQLASAVGLLAVLGEGVDSASVPGAVGADLRAGDPVRRQWDLVVLSPHFSAALLAHELADQPADAVDGDPRFEFAVVYDRETVSNAAHSLMARVGHVDDSVFSPAGRSRAAVAAPPAGGAAPGDAEAYVEQLERMAFRDGLTELGNRRRAQETFERAMTSVPGNGAVAVLYLDVDNFKEINDRYGHVVGDAVLQEIARRLRSRPRWRESVARIGGDEFLLVLPVPRLRAGGHAHRLAADLARLLTAPVDIDEQSVDVSVSIGVGVAPDDGTTYEEIVSVADRRMYARKHATTSGDRPLTHRIAFLRRLLARRNGR